MSIIPTDVKPLCVIQVDPTGNKWGCPLLCIVEEVKPWGVKCYSPHLEADGTASTLPLRVNHGDYVVIGMAEWATQ